MKPDEQWKGRDGSLVAAYRTMTVADARKRGDTAAAVLARLAAVIDGIPGAGPIEKRQAFDPWLAAVRHVYGAQATAAGLALLQAKGGRNGHA